MLRIETLGNSGINHSCDSNGLAEPITYLHWLCLLIFLSDLFNQETNVLLVSGS